MFGSLARISDLEERAFEIGPLPREQWAAGDYVVARVVHARGALARVETPTGRMAPLFEGDNVVGAFGDRHATLEAVGSWREIGADGRLAMLTAAGLLGKLTSVSQFMPPMVRLDYVGHVVRGGTKVRMLDWAPPGEPSILRAPIVLIVGTSMNSGKTLTAQVVVRRLKEEGLRVVGAKLSGAGRYRDIMSMADAGADAVLDFVDVGLPSSICPPDEFRGHLSKLLGLIADEAPEVCVIEAGASPLEPYNGDTIMAEIADKVACTILCASDPYAVAGVIQGFQRDPDLVAGPATNTSAGVELVERLSGVPALNLLEGRNREPLRKLLLAALQSPAPDA